MCIPKIFENICPNKSLKKINTNYEHIKNILMGREMGGKFKMEGVNVYLWLIHVEVCQKTTKVYKAIIL